MKWLQGDHGFSERAFFSKFASVLNAAREERAAYMRATRAADPEKSKSILRKSYLKHASRRREDARKQREKLKADPLAYAVHVEKTRIRRAERRATDPVYRLKVSLRTRIWMALHRHKGTKACKSMELVGCDLAHFRNHIESLWKPGMTWSNYGHLGWHVDHVLPIASFDLTIPSEQKKCFHYTNTRPMWWHDNLSKGSKPEALYKCGTGTSFQRVR